jgi:hypothetical protein
MGIRPHGAGWCRPVPFRSPSVRHQWIIDPEAMERTMLDPM